MRRLLFACRDLLRADGCFTAIAFFAPVDIDQCDDGAVDFVFRALLARVDIFLGVAS